MYNSNVLHKTKKNNKPFYTKWNTRQLLKNWPCKIHHYYYDYFHKFLSYLVFYPTKAYILQTNIRVIEHSTQYCWGRFSRFEQCQVSVTSIITEYLSSLYLLLSTVQFAYLAFTFWYFSFSLIKLLHCTVYFKMSLKEKKKEAKQNNIKYEHFLLIYVITTGSLLCYFWLFPLNSVISCDCERHYHTLTLQTSQHLR